MEDQKPNSSIKNMEGLGIFVFQISLSIGEVRIKLEYKILNY